VLEPGPLVGGLQAASVSRRTTDPMSSDHARVVRSTFPPGYRATGWDPHPVPAIVATPGLAAQVAKLLTDPEMQLRQQAQTRVAMLTIRPVSFAREQPGF